MLPHHILERKHSTSEASYKNLYFAFFPFMSLLKCVYAIILDRLCLCRAALLKCWERCTITAQQAINFYKPRSQDLFQNGATCFCLLLDARC